MVLQWELIKQPYLQHQEIKKTVILYNKMTFLAKINKILLIRRKKNNF